MALSNYLTSSELAGYITGSNSDTTVVKKLLTTKLYGIQGMPYQFMDTVDRRLTGTSIGRKYASKIVSHLPLLFLTPCKQVFMDDFNDTDKQTIANTLFSGQSIDESLINGTGRYYSVQFDYSSYFQYVNVMMRVVAIYLGLGDEEITINGQTNKLREFDWSKVQDESFKTFFSAQENVIFYLDSMTQISESYSNSTTESSLASMINGFADNANEIKFLFGSGGNLASFAAETASNVTSSLSSALSGAAASLGGGIIGSLASSGVNTVLDGGKIIFPEIWSDSSFDRSYSINFKLRSPDHDSLSIYLNVLKPYIMLLALVLPRMPDNGDSNSYKEPFLVKAYSKGMFNIDMGMITGMNVTKGDQCQWNDDGLPTQIDISIDIKDLYSSLVMSKYGDGVSDIVKNTSFMDFLANTAGLNIGQMEIGRKLKLYYYLQTSNIKDIPSRGFTRIDNGITNIMGKLYNIFS